MDVMKRGGKARKTMKQKQKQSIVIKNTINIGEKKRMRPRQRRARTQPKDGRQATGGGGGLGAGAFNPIGVQFPYQKLFQAPPNEVRSLTMSSANSNEASNNVSALIDKSQQISEGRIRSYINNALQFNAVKRMVESDAIQPSGVRIDEIEDEDEVVEVMPVIKKEPTFKERKIDTRPIDMTLDEENEIRSDLGMPQLEKPKEKVVVEDVSAEENKDELLPSTEKMREAIVKGKKSSGKKQIGYTEEERRVIRNIQSNKNKAIASGNEANIKYYTELEKSTKRDFIKKRGSDLLEEEYGISPSPK
jgi:hypothetical protein